MKSIFIIGNGQLGMMLRQAADIIGIKTLLIDLNVDKPLNILTEDIITSEVEYWKSIRFKNLINHVNFINRSVFHQLIDRLKQKKLLEHLRLPTTLWQLVDNEFSWPKIFSALGNKIILKPRLGSYNGYGQLHVFKNNIHKLPKRIYGKYIAEQKIEFLHEISLIGARSHKDDIVFYPISYNLNVDGILRANLVLETKNKDIQIQAEKILTCILRKLSYVGVMAMECFVTPNGLLINELAPRVHNTGHWTQDGASISQFELHLRAILNLPIPNPILNLPTVMINLIGIDIDYSWLSSPFLKLHWYSKQIYRNRKVGHLNTCYCSDHKSLNSVLTFLKSKLPFEYSKYIDWIFNILFQNKNLLNNV